MTIDTQVLEQVLEHDLDGVTAKSSGRRQPVQERFEYINWQSGFVIVSSWSPQLC
jgi:hypothetical protein